MALTVNKSDGWIKMTALNDELAEVVSLDCIIIQGSGTAGSVTITNSAGTMSIGSLPIPVNTTLVIPFYRGKKMTGIKIGAISNCTVYASIAKRGN